jgi:dTDP-4-amino-4,6-dideoxygalactose transaminase
MIRKAVNSMRDMIPINQPSIGKEEIEAVVEVLKSGILTEKSGRGPRVLQFEKEFAKFVGAKHAIAVSSGTAALHASLLAAGIQPGDEVVVPSFTFSATAGAVVLAGGKPAFADIDADTYCITRESIEAVLTRATKVIMPVHMYGLCADMDPITELARNRGIVVIEDAAQAHGAEYNGRKAGSLGDAACFSFYPGKNMTTGEGGMITTSDDDLAEQVRRIRTHGEERPYWVARQGHNYRMPEMAAAIGAVQLKKLPGFLQDRRKNAEYLSEKLGVLGKLVMPKEPAGRRHAWYLFTARLRGANAGKRNKLVEKLRSKNIGCSVYYESPVHMLPYYRDLQSTRRSALPETERACRQVFSLPVHPMLKQTELQYVTDSVRRAI